MRVYREKIIIIPSQCKEKQYIYVAVHFTYLARKTEHVNNFSSSEAGVNSSSTRLPVEEKLPIIYCDTGKQLGKENLR